MAAYVVHHGLVKLTNAIDPQFEPVNSNFKAGVVVVVSKTKR